MTKKKKFVSAKVCEVGGMTCVVRKTEMGVFTGYVGLPKGHPLFGKGYSECGRYIDVHGGLTYADESLPWWKPDGKWWLGFDCAHAGDAIPNLMEGEGLVYRDEEFAREEVTGLAKQMVRLLTELN